MFVFKAAVVGAGVMGGEIAQVIAAADIPVLLKDVDQRFVDTGLQKAREVTETAAAKVVIQPILDPTAPLAADSYQIPDRIRRAVTALYPTVVFPYSNRSTTGGQVDLDHITTWPDGPTATGNLAPLDRRRRGHLELARLRRPQRVPGHRRGGLARIAARAAAPADRGATRVRRRRRAAAPR